jgi:type VI secretion system protein VasD
MKCSGGNTSPSRLASTVVLALTVAVFLALSACAAKPPKPVKAHMTVTARADVNPDAMGRPSPIIVRVYQLKDDAAFSGADFFAVFDQEQATLGPSLIGREEFAMAPGAEQSLEYPVSQDASFVGVVAAFRDIRNAEWRVLKPAPHKALKDVVKKNTVSVVVERSRVTLSVAD